MLDGRLEAGHDTFFVMTGLDPVIQSLPGGSATAPDNGSSRGAGNPL
jgi:hypothetical protein